MRAKRLAVVALLTILAASACQKRARVTAPPVPALPPVTVTALDQADRQFAQGEYDAAARSYEDYLKLSPSGGQRDQALYRLGLTYALRSNPGPDWRRATAAFRQLTDEYPASILKPSATLILSLRSEIDQVSADTRQRDLRIRQLTGELEKLKNIDAERRKRP